jgi:ribosomal protein S18 acetylase RimI-like enzyme
MEIREVRPDEHEAAGAVAVAGYLDFYRDALGYYADHLRDVSRRARGAIVLVAVDGARIVGTVTYIADSTSAYAENQLPDEASIRMLAVAPEHKRSGIGRALSMACVERARAGGKRAIVLHADAIMEGARRLYEGIGFVREPARDYRPDDATLLLCYRLALSVPTGTNLGS